MVRGRSVAANFLPVVFEDLDSVVSDDVRSYFLNAVDGIAKNDGIFMVGSLYHICAGIMPRPISGGLTTYSDADIFSGIHEPPRPPRPRHRQTTEPFRSEVSPSSNSRSQNVLANSNPDTSSPTPTKSSASPT